METPIPIFRWHILLPVKDSNRIPRPQLITQYLSSNGVSCFLLKIAIVRGPQLTTQSPSSDGISCFLLEIAIVKGHAFGQNTPPPIAKYPPIAKIPPPIAKIPPPYRQNTTLLSPKYHPPIAKIPPSYRQNTTPLSRHLFKYPPNEHVPC